MLTSRYRSTLSDIPSPAAAILAVYGSMSVGRKVGDCGLREYLEEGTGRGFEVKDEEEILIYDPPWDCTFTEKAYIRVEALAAEILEAGRRFGRIWMPPAAGTTSTGMGSGYRSRWTGCQISASR